MKTLAEVFEYCDLILSSKRPVQIGGSGDPHLKKKSLQGPPEADSTVLKLALKNMHSKISIYIYKKMLNLGFRRYPYN